jgi:hypothetical protein
MLVSGTIAYTQSTPPEKFSATVKLQVSSRDADLKNLITSYVSRELRALGDVRLVEEPDYDYLISIVAFWSPSGTERLGYTISALTQARLADWQLAQLLKGNSEKLSDGLVNFIRYKYHRDVDHVLLTGREGQLGAACASIVADLDADELKEQRASHEKMVELFRRKTDKK